MHPGSEFKVVFGRLRGILKMQARTLVVSEDTDTRYCLEGMVGPATLRAWGGKMKRGMLPVAWVEIGKSDVSFHLMGIYGDSKLRAGMSKELKKRMQGKTCFNFTSGDEAIFVELEELTARGFRAFKRAGFIQ